MATQIDMEHKPTLAEWLGTDPWFDSLLRGVWDAFRKGYATAHDETALRLGTKTGPAGPQVKGTG
jgi:hypothetical protein